MIDLVELIPIVAVNDEVLEENKHFKLKKESDGAVRIWLIEKHLEIYMTPPDKNPPIIYPGVEKPKFWFNGHKIQPSNYTILSHMKGNFPGVTIRFFGGLPIKVLQFIPRLTEDPKSIEKKKSQKSDWQYGMSKGFDMDYFKEYDIK